MRFGLGMRLFGLLESRTLTLTKPQGTKHSGEKYLFPICLVLTLTSTKREITKHVGERNVTQYV